MKEIKDNNGNLLAIFISYKSIKKEKDFVTDSSLDFQLASFNLKKDTVVEKHYHPSQDRSIKTTSEVIVVLKGKIQVDIYDEGLKLIENQLVSKGETMAMFAGGHGITVIEDCKLIETKQGPFDEETDKIRF